MGFGRNVNLILLNGIELTLCNKLKMTKISQFNNPAMWRQSVNPNKKKKVNFGPHSNSGGD